MSLTGKIEPENFLTGSVSSSNTLQAKSVSVNPRQSLSDMDDIDISEREEGSIIIYDEASKTFKVKSSLENANTQIIGGSF